MSTSPLSRRDFRHSNHELGLAAGLGYPDTSAQRGAHAVASDCALVFPVPYEPWHVEPVGLTG